MVKERNGVEEGENKVKTVDKLKEAPINQTGRLNGENKNVVTR